MAMWEHTPVQYGTANMIQLQQNQRAGRGAAEPRRICECWSFTVKVKWPRNIPVSFVRQKWINTSCVVINVYLELGFA